MMARNTDPYRAEFIFENKNVFAFGIISQRWVGTGSWNSSFSKKRTCLLYIFNTMAVDGVVTQGAKASAAIELT